MLTQHSKSVPKYEISIAQAAVYALDFRLGFQCNYCFQSLSSSSLGNKLVDHDEC